jgi:hypothetical protein
VGKQEINLTGMDVTDLRVTNAVGRTTVTLPQEAKLDGELKTAVGILTIYVPKGASVRIQTDTGLTTRNYPSGWSNNEHTLSSPAAASGTPAYNLNVNVGLGSLEIVELP